MDIALKDAEAQSKSSGDGPRAFGGSQQLSNMTGLLAQVPGAGGLARQAHDLQVRSNNQEQSLQFPGPPGSTGGPSTSNVPGTNIDPMKTAAQIYPILEFRDKVVKAISATIEKIPGLEALVDKMTETLTLFVLSLLAPFIRPVINAVSAQLKVGSTGVIDASGRHQYEPWTDPHCSDPTHSLLSKDHFSNILNEPAGQVASAILQYVAPRIIYAWEHPGVPVDQVLNDIAQVFHHPATRDHHCEVHQKMYSTVERWARSRPDGGNNLNHLLGSASVRQGKNHTVDASQQSHSHGGLPSTGNFFGAGSHSKVAGAPWEQLGNVREAPSTDYVRRGAQRGSGIQGSFPGTQTEVDNTLSSTGTGALYAPRPAQHDPYIQSTGSDNQQGPNPRQPPQPGYDEAPPYGYDANAPTQSQQYGYQASPQQPGQYYGGGQYQ